MSDEVSACEAWLAELAERASIFQRLTPLAAECQ
jgi:hypothetical protein